MASKYCYYFQRAKCEWTEREVEKETSDTFRYMYVETGLQGWSTANDDAHADGELASNLFLLPVALKLTW